MYHVELRQFPHQGRAFNLSAAELQRRIVAPWLAGRAIELDEQRFSPARAKIAIFEGPELAPDQLGLGRGWSNVTRDGEDVTTALLRAPDLKDDVLQAAERGSLTLNGVVELAGRRYPGSRLSERLTHAENATWELLHAGRLNMRRAGRSIAREDWAATLLELDSWAGAQVELISRHEL